MTKIRRSFAALLLILLLATAAFANVTVYITRTGEKYHTGGCQYLRKSKIAISLSDAKARGYDACSRCRPPQ